MKYAPIALRVVISLTIVGGAVAGYLWLGESEVYTRPPARESVPQVKTIVAENHLDGLQIEVDGVVVPYREINIAAEVGGKVIYKSDRCRTGRTVKAGEVLIRIDPQDYELEVRRLTEELKQADATIGELEAELETTENQITAAREQLKIEQRQLKRNLDLLKRRAASDSEVDAVRKSELATRNSLQMLVDQKQLIKRRKVRLESAKMLGKANLEKASLALDRTKICSPIDAIVVSDLVEQDGYVQAGATMLTLQDSSSLDVTCMLHDYEMNWLWQSEPTTSEASMSEAFGDIKKDTSQDPAKLVSTETKNPEVKNPATDEADTVDFPRTPATVVYEVGGTPYRWSGVLDRYDGSGFDAQTRMVPCRINIDNPDSAIAYQGKIQQGERKSNYAPDLMTGMFVKVLIRADPPTPLVRLPQQAIQPGSVIWTVKDGKLKRQEISIATSTNENVIAYQKAGELAAGDKIVVSPLATPVEGMDVIEAGSPEAEAAAKAEAEAKSSGWGGKRKAGGGPGGRTSGKPNSKNKASGK